MDQAAELTKIQQISSVTQEEFRILANTVSMAQVGGLNPNQITTKTLQVITEFVKIACDAQNLISPV